MSLLRSTERHLNLLRIPFGAKLQRKIFARRYASDNYKGTAKKSYIGPQRAIRAAPIPVRPITTNAVATSIKVPLMNPNKPNPDDIKDVVLAPITPATVPRFPKNSEVLPSVTKILSATMPAASQYLLDRWKEAMIKKLGPAGFSKYQQDTFERGRLLHALVASYLMGQGEPQEITHEIVSKLWKSIETVVKESISNVRLVEHVVTHEQMKYRGIVDCVAFYRDELVVIDFKTAEKPKKSIESLFDNPLQITAYCGALNNDKTLSRTLIDRNICAGLIIVAYIDGSKASVYHIGRDQILDYWTKWSDRLDQYVRCNSA